MTAENVISILKEVDEALYKNGYSANGPLRQKVINNIIELSRQPQQQIPPTLPEMISELYRISKQINEYIRQKNESISR